MESSEIRTKMVNKRMKKLDKIIEKSIEPVLYGHKNYDYLFVSWGSTSLILKEALENLESDRVALLHFSQLYPLPKSSEKYLKNAKKLILVEQNVTGQFADLIKQTYGINTSNRILKYDGFPFSVEELTKKIKEEL